MRGNTKVVSGAAARSTYEEDFDPKKWRAEMEARPAEKATPENRDKVMEDTLASAKRSLGLMDECEVRGGATMTELERQRQQINRVDQQVNALDQHMAASDRLLRGMGSLGGAVVNYFTADNSYRTKPPSPRDGDVKKPAEEGGGSSWLPSFLGGSVTEEKKKDGNGGGSPPKTDYSSMFEDRKVQEFFEETDECLDDMSRRADLLNAMAKDMGTALDDDNEKLARLGRKMDTEVGKIQNTNRKINRLL